MIELKNIETGAVNSYFEFHRTNNKCKIHLLRLTHTSETYSTILLQMKTFSHPNLESVSLASVMQALADPCRLKIVLALKETQGKEFACKDFQLDISKATASHHFETLRNAGIIQTRSEGVKCLSSLREDELNKRFPGLLDLIAAEAATALAFS